MKKRVFDVALSSGLLIGLSPVYAALYCLVRAGIGKPVIFKQDRLGYQNKFFTIYKFRTMTDKRDTDGNLLPSDQRLTRMGKYLRYFGIDELPQLYNIFKGDMSFVGPRPLSQDVMQRVYSPLPHKNPFELVKPGLTSPAHLSLIYNRSPMNGPDRLKVDWEYATKPPSIRRDLKIIAATAPVLILGHTDMSMRRAKDPGHYII